jgi:hypothetical protein
VTALIGILLSDSASHAEGADRRREVAAREDCWFVAAAEVVAGVARTRKTVVLETSWEARVVPA